MIAEGRLGLKSGSGFYDYDGRDVAAYRRDVLGRTLAQVRDAGLWRAAGEGHTAVTPTVRRGYVDVAHGQMHYAACGDDDATTAPVVLLHQTPRSWREYAQVLPLIGARRRAIAVDTAGFGASDPVPRAAGIEAWAEAALRAARRARHRLAPTSSATTPAA